MAVNRRISRFPLVLSSILGDLGATSYPQSKLVWANLLVDPLPSSQLLKKTRAVPLSFYERPAAEVAQGLLGCVLVHDPGPGNGTTTAVRTGLTAGMIVETEAYLGAHSLGQPDRAAHSFRGLTPRTAVIFGPPGRAYVYFIYGMHECLNVVAEPAGIPGGVLIRALEPLTGLATMADRRGGKRQGAGRITDLTNGPGKLTQAMGITRQHYGVRLDRPPLTIREWKEKPQLEVEVTPRIGIRECADWPLRFFLKGNRFVSR